MNAQILIVEDDPTIRRLLRHRLLRESYGVLEAENAFRAVDIMSSEPVDLLVTDHKMPGMTGIELIRQIRHLREIPAILITGFTETLDLVEDQSTKILRKPFEMSEFVSWVTQFCSLKNRGGGGLKI